MIAQSNIIDKRKRTSTSGSRSKSKKSPNVIKTQINNSKHDQTVQLKPKQSHHIFHNQDICAKIKTENSLSINKSKGSKKNSKSLKKPLSKQSNIVQKRSIKQSKDQSYLVSAQRKHSINKINKTQTTHVQSQDIYKKLYSIKKQLSKIQIPLNFSIVEIQSYFNNLKQFFQTLSIQPLESILLQVHQMYINPIQNLLSTIKPYQNMLKRKQQIYKLIKQQLQQNQKLYQQLDPEDIEIIKLKQKISKNAQLIDSIKKKKKGSPTNNLMKKKKSSGSQNYPTYIDITSQSKKMDQTNPLKTDNNFSSSKIDDQQFERKLNKQYDKLPKFQQDAMNKKLNTNFAQNNTSEQSQGYSFNQKQKQRFCNEQKLKNKVFNKQFEQSLPQNQQIQHPVQPSKHQHQNSQQLFDAQSQSNILQVHQQQKIGMKSGGLSFNFKLDIPKIDRGNVGFHDQFYSKLDQFSQSWRNQALREKRF